VEYIQPPAAHSNRDLLAIHRGSQHYGSPASHHDSLYAPATVYVTAAGYQQIAIPPPAHHARPVLPPPMQPAAVFQHPPVVGAQYAQYAPLSPGKTRYLYWDRVEEVFFVIIFIFLPCVNITSLSWRKQGATFRLCIYIISYFNSHTRPSEFFASCVHHHCWLVVESYDRGAFCKPLTTAIEI